MQIRSRRFDKLYDFARRYASVCRSPLVDKDDAVQEMMVAVVKVRWRNWKYAKAVMRHHYINLINKEKVRVKYVEFVGEYPQVVVKFREGRAWLQEILAQVGKEETLLVLKLHEGFTIKEIAKQEGRALKTIYRKLEKIESNVKI